MSRLRVALLQLRAFDVGEADACLRHILEAIDEAAGAKPSLVVLPEMAYPAYFLGGAPADAFGAEKALEALRDRARTHGFSLAAGLALPAGDGGLVNGAVFIGPDGSVLGRYAKAFLWHFDRRWFRPGAVYPVIDAPFGRVGMLICADGRLPEIARCLAVGGARLLIDLTAWVAWGLDPGDLTSVQREYLMRARAIENGVPVVAADKAGVEQNTIVYCGRSCVIGPDGELLASLGPDEEGVLLHDLDLPEAPRPPTVRRPGLYRALVEPTASLPVTRALGELVAAPDESRRVAAVQALAPEGEALLPFLERWLRLLAAQDCDLALFPAPPLSARPVGEGVREAVARLTGEAGVDACVTVVEERDGRRGRVAYVCSRGRVALAHRQTHGAGIDAGDAPCPVVETALGATGVLVADEGLAPEVARSLMLRGAEALLWAEAAPERDVAIIARTRADENRCALAVACLPSPSGATLVVSPQGQIVAAALRGREMACHGQVNRALAHWKDMAPGTHVVYGRQPETYAALVAPRE